MPLPQQSRPNGAPPMRRRAKTPPDTVPPVIGGSGDNETSGWFLTIRFFVPIAMDCDRRGI